MPEPIDVAALRETARLHQTSNLAAGVNELCRDVLRILDALEAMEKRRWDMSSWREYDKDGNENIVWVVETVDLEEIEGPSPLAALLAAAEKEQRDG